MSTLVLPTWGQAQSVPMVSLDDPLYVEAEPFSQVRGVRELSDGRVLVSDWVEERVVLIDPSTSMTMPVGGVGRGPREYRLPAELIGLPGDSTLLVDMGNSRLAVIGPDGIIHRSFSTQQPTVPYGMHPRGADDAGRLYFIIPRWARGAAPNAVDSAAPVARWDPIDGRVDTLLAVRGVTPRSDAGLPRSTLGLPYVPFSLQDGWRILADGGVVVIRAEGYSVEGITGEGGWWRGGSVPYRPVPVRGADKEAFVRRFLAMSPMSGRGPDGGMGHTPTDQMTEAAVAEIIATNEFGDRLPPFDPALVWLAPDGELWVGRWMPAGEAQVYDVFDRAGRRRFQVQLGPARQVAGLGDRRLYVTQTDEDGLQVLELYARPAR